MGHTGPARLPRRFSTDAVDLRPGFPPAAQAPPCALWTLAELGAETGMEDKIISQHTIFCMLYDEFGPETVPVATSFPALMLCSESHSPIVANVNAAGDKPAAQ